MNIDVDKIRDIALLGVRRSSAFMALGLKIREMRPIKDLRLDESIIAIFPEKITDENSENILKEFCDWIIGCGLRELESYFCIFLDNILSILLHAKNRALSEEDTSRKRSSFEGWGLIKKLEEIERIYNIKTAYKDEISSISKVRNCLTHGGGVVSDRHCNEESPKGLRIKWIGIRMTFDGEKTGRIISIQDGKGFQPFDVGDDEGAIAFASFPRRDVFF